MASIKIPERYESGLAIILFLSDESTAELISVLQSAPPKIFPMSLSEEIAPKVQSISISDLHIVIETLQSLYYTKLHQDISPSDMSEDVWEAMEKTKKYKLSDQEWEQFKGRLVNLLSIESLNVLAKALAILRNNERVFHDARIITEIRPIFGSTVEASPTAAVILHMLNITYHREGRIKEFHIALDTDDLEALREAIDRAETKANTLRSMLDEAHIDYLDTE